MYGWRVRKTQHTAGEWTQWCGDNVSIIRVCRLRNVVWLTVVGLGLLLGGVETARAATGTWTNYLSGGSLSDYWTNNASWTGVSHPGVSSDSAYLTNQVALAYTNILNAKINNAIVNLAISNALGEAWLVVTNTALTNSTSFALGTGGRVRIDNGGTLRVNSTFTWLGTNAVIHLNSGGNLVSAGLTYGAAGGVTGLVTSTSGAGNGGVWNLGGVLNVGTGATGRDNNLRVGDGAILSNVTGLTVGNNVGATSNTLIIAEGSQFFMNTAASVFIGSAGIAGVGGNGNSVTISNGQIRFTAAALALVVGFGSSNNTFTLLGDTWVDMNGGNINLSSFPVNTGGTTISRAYNNQILIDGAILTNVGHVSVGYMDSGGGSSSIAISNKLEVINGGILSNVTRLQIGGGTVPVAGSGYNSLIVTGGGRLVMSPAGTHIIIGGAGAGDNTVILSNSVLAANTPVNIGVGSSNNLLRLLDSTWNNRGAALTIGSGLSTGNVVRVSQTLLTNFGAVIVGNSAGSSGNQFLLETGSVLSNVTALRVGIAAGANSNRVVISELFMPANILPLTVGAPNSGGVGGSDNSVILSNAFIRMANSTSAIVVGGGSTNNSLRLVGNSLVDVGGSGINVAGYPIASGASPILHAYNNTMLVEGALITNVGTITIGWMNSATGTILSRSNRLDVVGGSVLSNVTHIQVGGGNTTFMQGSSYNSLIVTGGASLHMNETGTGFVVGGTGAGDNTVILHNSRLSVNSSLIGSGSSNNTVELENSIWNNRGAGLNVGNGFATGNILRVSGSVLTNFGVINIGAVAGSSGNQLFLENGSVLSNTLLVRIGGTTGANSNRAFIADSTLTITGLVVAGNINAAGGFNNTATITNSAVRFTGINNPLTVGWGSTNSSLTLLAGTRLDLNTNGINVAGNLINFGGIFNPRTYDNFLLVNGGVVSNVGIVNLAYLFAAGGSIIAVSNRIEVVNGGVLSNVTQLLIGGGVSPQGSGYNSLIVTGGGRLFMEANATTIRVGESGATHNQLLVSNSSLVGNSTVIGNGAASNNATLFNSVWNNRGGAFTIGNGGISNALVLDNNSLLTNISTFLVGSLAGANSNAAHIANGSLLVASTAQAGSSANNNSILVTDGGILQANSLVIGAGTTGNTISNRNATYQFTNAPVAITSLTPGDIALTDGTISFRATGAANVATNASNLIRTIRYAGANTFTLNNASNTAAAVSQTYTFDALAGNPSNFVNLVMVNGTTAYQNANGANLTIGTAGSLLISNTTAIISGGLTNHGVADVVGARAQFQNAVVNHGTLTFFHGVGTFNSAVVNHSAWITDPSTNVFLSSHTVTTNGYLSASTGDVFRFHNGLTNQSTNNLTWQTLNVTPGTNTIGGGTLFEFAGTSLTHTQEFTHPGLLLTGGFDGTPTPLSNGVQGVTSFGDVTGFQANFALAQLWVTNTTLVLTQAVAGAGALFVNDLFLLDTSNTHLVIADNMRLYFVNSNGWDMTSITLLGNAEIHQLFLENMVVIPEPNVLLLCVAGLLTLWLARRRQHA
ncbi:MAG: hypothetical protein PCFJNLEI_02432 [Verrucomicrobiae bacterium]|nr:hypothetical protein [Verrucomicrobiae bacterium]